MARTNQIVAALGACGLAVSALAGCVDSFGGSNVQMDFSEGTPLPARVGQTPTGAQPPADTYMVFYAIDNVYDETLDPPVIVQSYVYEIQRFELRPVIDTSTPCLIDLPGQSAPNFPGLHVTMIEEKVKEVTGIDDPFDPPNDAREDEVTDVLTARVRFENLSRLQSVVKAVTSYSTFRYPAPLADGECNFTGDQIPGRDCMDDASNAQRLRVCQQLWDENPEFYEGSDKVFNLPLNGQFYGAVEGSNPVNSGFVGGSQIFVDEVLAGFDAFAVNWKYKDEAMNTSPVGESFMIGEPEERVRGVIHVRMTSPFDATIFAETAIFSGLGDDDVHF